MSRTLLAIVALAAVLTGCTTIPSSTPDTPTSSSASAEDANARLAFDQGVKLDALLAQYPQAVIPDAKLVRTVTLEEWPTTMAQCLTDQGFPSTVVDGGVSSTNIVGQEEAKEVARYVCNVEYALDPKFNQPLTASQLDQLYEYYTGDLTNCLEANGQEVAAPPSRQLFGEAFNTIDSWSPYLSVAGSVSADEWTELNKACPQVPEGLYG